MDAAVIYLVVCTVLCCFCTGASWMLQVVCYPTYALVGDQEFVPFHVDFGKRLLVAVVVPMLLTSVMIFALVFLRPAAAPIWAALVAAGCIAVILITTIVIEVPKHQKLDREGKSLEVIRALVSNNLPRVVCWMLASLMLLVMVVSVAAA
jgi:hypothetical protein